MSPETYGLLGTIGGGIVAVVGTLLAKRTKGPGDEAAVRKAEQEIVKVALDNTRDLIEQKDRFHDAQVMALTSRVTSLEERLIKFQATIIAHQPWDVDALGKLRNSDPGWPSPPPIDGV